MSGSALLQAARLWERTSGKGTRYMSGRLGGVKVVILPNRDFDAEDSANSHTHIMFFSDGTPAQPRAAERAPAEPREPGRAGSRSENGRANGGPIDDDPIPF